MRRHRMWFCEILTEYGVCLRSFPRFALGLDFMGFVSKLIFWCFKTVQLLMSQLYKICFLSLTRAVDMQQLHVIYILTTTAIVVQW
jgi:hypothetical protein